MLALRPRSARMHGPEPEAGAVVAFPRTAQPPSRAPLAPYTRADAVAMIGLLILSLALFGPHLLGLTTFVGNSDRLHSFLSMRDMAVNAWQTNGRVPAWTDALLLGIPIYGFHWMALALDPISPVVALFPEREVFRVTGAITALHHAAGAIAAYLLIRDIVRQPFAAAVGAALYGCSVFAIHRISQFDSTFALLIILPLGMLVLRTVRPGRAAIAFVGLTASVTAIVGFTFLQEALYALLWLGLYACYRSAATRTWRPVAIVVAAGLVGVLLATPRLVSVVEDFRELSRSSAIQSTCPCELLRWLDDGIFGRFPSEAITLGNMLNLHEGFQLHTSTFAALAVIVMLLRPRGGAARLVGLGFPLVLALLFLPTVGARRQATLLMMVLVTALLLWAVARPHLGRRFRMPGSVFLDDPDLPLFALVVTITAAIVLSDAVGYLVYLVFFRVDFTHARIAVVALLPLCTLAAVFVRELFGEHEAGRPLAGARHLKALAVGGTIAVGGLLLLNRSVPAAAPALFGPAEGLSIGNAYLVSAQELARVVLTVALFLAALALTWLARHVEVRRVGGGLRMAWRDVAEGAPLARLVPAYALGCLMVAQAFGHAYFQLNGEHTQTYPVPFVANNYFTPPADVLVPPSPAARQAVRERLEADAYRSITVSAPDGYPTYDWGSERGYGSWVALFWQLRLANGYGVLTWRDAALPWPDASRTLRAISFRDQTTLPWPLLAALNVKYAVVASPSLLFNVPADPARLGSDAGPDDLTILENPLPVVPRAFFAGAVVPRVPAAAPTTTPLPTPPAAFRATALPEHDVALSWTGEIADATYQIHRRQLGPAPEGAGAQIAQTDRGANVFYDQGLAPAATFEYQIRTCDRRGCGDLSAPIQVQVAAASVAAPHSLAVAARSPSEALVTWEPADEQASILLELLTGAGAATGPAVELPAGTRSYRVSGLRPLRDYAIRLRACTPGGCSPHTAPKRVSMPSSLDAAELDGVIPADPIRESVVEGLDGPLALQSTAGAIHADYREPDRLRIRVEPAEVQRFLVVNELYHPNWHAYANGPDGRTELTVYPTNVVMRGVLVPPGASEIELRFEPFIRSWLGLLPVLAGLLLGAVGWLALRRLDRARRAG